MPPYRHSENKARYRLCLMIRCALPPMTARLLCPGCYWGTPLPDGRIHCSFWHSCPRREVRAWK